MESTERYGKRPYVQHLKGLADGEIMLVPNQKTDVMRRLQSASSAASDVYKRQHHVSSSYQYALAPLSQISVFPYSSAVMMS